MSLREYRRKRRFERTPEPAGVRARRARRSFVVQKHAATRLHYDFRLEHGGVLLSWAVPKGPSLDPREKRLAVRVEDHPVDYGSFEGVIPEGEYGGGAVLLWDRGRWEPEGDVEAGLESGKLDFELFGDKLSGRWSLVRLRAGSRGERKNWLLIKRRDAAARADGAAAITDSRPASVASGRSIAEIGTNPRARVWSSRRAKRSARTAAAPEKTARARSRRRAARKPRMTGERPGMALAAVPGARRARLPGFVPPQLATLVARAPEGDEWIHEIKYDGYRMLVELDRGRVRLISRNGHDWTERFGTIVPELAALPAAEALIDGEVVVLGRDGVSHFQALQQALCEGASARLTYYAFDLLHLDGYDLRSCALIERKRVLQALLARAGEGAGARYSDHVLGRGPAFLAAACEKRLEGIVSKRAAGGYRSGRSREWTKEKCSNRQEFVVVGFTEPKGSRAGIGSLVLAVNEAGKLRLAGRVGTGFDHATLVRLREQLQRLRVDAPSVEGRLRSDLVRGVRWVEPRMVVEVSFTDWTSDGLLRHPSFEGLRQDKDPREIVREEPAAPRRSARRRGTAVRALRAAGVRGRTDPGRGDRAAVVAGVRITHPERVLDPESGVTKLDLALHYERVAALLLPHVVERPLSVVRCPRGFSGACFFQKHGGDTFPEAVKSIPLRDSSGEAHYLAIDSLEGLLSLVQMNVVELHPWGSRADLLERPDRMFFDLDPAPDVAWERVVAAGLRLRDLLARLGVESFAKTTGGKGLHVVVPLARRYGWERVKAFSRAIALDLARADPREFVAVASKAARKGRIFVDYLRNSRGATAVAPYSVRARPGAPVSQPVSWRELAVLQGPVVDHVMHGGARAARKARDPWAAFLRRPQGLPAS